MWNTRVWYFYRFLYLSYLETAVFPYTVLIIAVIVDFTIFCLLIFVLAYLSRLMLMPLYTCFLFVGFFPSL